jgi:hypothetical protein
VRTLAEWWQENNFSFTVNKTKELIVDFRKQQREHAPIHLEGAEVEKVKSFNFLGIHITDNLKWSTHTDSVKKALNNFILASKTLTNFYICTIESIFSGCITAWYGNCTVCNYRAHQRVVQSAQCITRVIQPALQDTYSTQCHRKAKKIIKDINHLCHGLFTQLSSRR